MSRKLFVTGLILILALGMLFAEFGPSSDSKLDTFSPPASSEMKGFGPSSDIELDKTVSVKNDDFWFHDIAIKILIVIGLITASLLIFVFSRKKKWYRKLMMISSVVIIGFVFGGFLCPTTAVQNVIIKFGTAYTLLFSIPLLSTLFFGRIYCSSVCPYGAISELLHIRKFAIKVPKKVDSVLKYIKYGILAFLLLRIFLTGDLLDNTPFKAVFEFGGNPLNWIMTGVFIFLSLFVYRPFCRYFCPYGAIMALISKISFIKLRKDDYCISCRICERECQMDAMDKNAKTNAECILCGDCCTKCPKDSLSLSTNKKRR
jgi:polyferredoxin